MSPDNSPIIPINVELTVQGRRLRATIPAPAGPSPPAEMLHVLQSLADALVGLAAERSAAAGKPPSCRAGCAACCRQLVPISRTEARRIAAVVAALPEPRRGAVYARFDDARSRLAAAGLLDRLRDSASMTKAQAQPLGEAYFRAGVPCPLLEDDACSIYPDRPLICREYLVSSDRALCDDPAARHVQKIPVNGKLGGLVGRWERQLDRPDAPPLGEEEILPWVAMVLAPEWSNAHPEPEPTHAGPRQVEALMAALTGKSSGGEHAY